MRKIKDVLRLCWGQGLSKPQTARSCGLSRPAVDGYLRRAEAAGLGWSLPVELDDGALERLLFPPAPAVHPLPGMVLVDGLSQDSVERMRADGLEPVATVETAPNVHQVWVRVAEHITKPRRDKIARYLAELYGGDVDSAGANSYGRLAGFTSGEPLPGAQRPFVMLKQSDSTGKLASAAAKVLRATRPAAQRRPKDVPAPPGGGHGAG